MEKGAPNVFANDGSFMQKFQQLEQEKQAKEVAAVRSDSGNSELASTSNKRSYDSKINEKKPVTSSNGKLAFSLKPKPKIAVAPVLLAADEDEDDNERLKGHVHEPLKRPRTGPSNVTSEFGGRAVVAQVPTPSDPTVKNVADKLASFVAKHGRQFEDVTRQRNPGDTPFKFLFDLSSSDYKYYEYRLKEEEKAFAPSKDNHTSSTASIPSHASSSGQRGPTQPPPNYQIPTSALYDAEGEHSGAPSNDPIAMVEFYMKRAAAEERKRPLRRAKDEMPPPASLQAPPSKKGHHMGDYIPPEELEKFLSTCNDVAAQKAAKEAAERAKIQADNVGHRLLSKMGWKEGEGLGSSKSGRAEPVMAGNVKSNNLGVGAEQPGEVTPEDDIYEQYKKRMMLGYRYRPNPLNNPRKAYY